MESSRAQNNKSAKELLTALLALSIFRELRLIETLWDQCDENVQLKRKENSIMLLRIMRASG